MKMMRKIIKYKYLYLKVFLCFVLLIYSLRNITQLEIPSIMLDEIGYWASAAYFKGYNWSGVMGNFSSYYSYGYSILLFVIMNITKNPICQHQLAIALNSSMLIVSFLMLIEIIKTIYPKINYFWLIVACFTALFYPSVQYHSQVAWSETYLFMMFILSCYMVTRIYINPNTINQILFMFIIYNLYIIHQRCLGILIIGTAFIFIINIYKTNKKRILNIFLSIVLLIILLYAGKIIKNLVYQNVYTDTLIVNKVSENAVSYTNANDFGGQISKIMYLFTLEGFYNFCISYLGKLWYFGIASLYLGFNGITKLFNSIIEASKKKNFKNLKVFISVYILSSYILTTGIAAIFMIIPSRWDTVAYGRYTDWIGIIIVVIGMLDLCENRKHIIKKFFCFNIATIVFLMLFLEYAQRYSISGFFASCSQIMLYFKNINEDNFILIMTLVTTLLGAFIYSLVYFNKKYIAVMLIIIVWTIFTKPGIDELIVIERKDWVCPVVEYINSNKCENVYYYYSDDTTFSENAYVGNIQYLLQDKPIICVKNLEEIKDENACIISGWTVKYNDDYKIKLDAGFYRIAKK